MLSSGRIGTACVVVAASLLAGCYASTEPATDVGPETATLRAQGKANNGPAESRFEYWVTGSAGRVRSNAWQSWPAGASGPFSHKLTGLAASTAYSFRVCGRDQGVEESACAQTRSFTTTPAVEDVAHGSFWAGCCSSFAVNARSGPSGEDPRGFMSWNRGGAFDPDSYHFTGIVTCLEVHGRQAAIGAIGEYRVSQGEPVTGTLLATIEDGVTGTDTYFSDGAGPGSTPPDCSTATFGRQLGMSPEFEFVVNDAQP